MTNNKYNEDEIQELHLRGLVRGIKVEPDKKAIDKRKQLEERKFQLELRRIQEEK